MKGNIFISFYFMKPLTFTPKRIQGHAAHQLHMLGNQGTEKWRFESKCGLLGGGTCWSDCPHAGGGRKSTAGD